MSNQRVTIEIKQGAAWKATVQIKNGGIVRDLTGYEAHMQLREKVGSPVIVDLNTSNGLIAINTTNNTISINIPAASTKTFTFTKAEFDLFIVPPASDPEKILEGTASLIKSITVF
jgi:hypothetical protein